MRPARAEDYITKRTSVVPDFEMKTMEFDKFLNEITSGGQTDNGNPVGDEDLKRYPQRIAG